ncbi:hypothetical protein C0J45_23697, partial [Silurus meridionalis]
MLKAHRERKEKGIGSKEGKGPDMANMAVFFSEVKKHEVIGIYPVIEKKKEYHDIQLDITGGRIKGRMELPASDNKINKGRTRQTNRVLLENPDKEEVDDEESSNEESYDYEHDYDLDIAPEEWEREREELEPPEYNQNQRHRQKKQPRRHVRCESTPKTRKRLNKAASLPDIRNKNVSKEDLNSGEECRDEEEFVVLNPERGEKVHVHGILEMTPKMPRKSDPLHTEVKTLQEEMTLHEGENAANTQERIERMEEILKDTRREMDHTKEIITKVTGNDVWNALRAAYPTQSDPTKVENLKIDGKKGAAAFILRLQKAWAEEMGSAWDETTANITLFRIMVKRALPSEVQEKLESVVGLNAMPWASFQANVTHAVEMHRKKKEATKQAAEDLITLLHKAQLGELTRSKQENQEKRKEEKISAKQAAVMMAPTTAQQDPAGQTTPDQGNQQLMPVGQTMMDYPTNQQNGGWGQERGRGRGGMFRPRPRNYQPPRGGRCWNCQDPNHMMRNCPYPIRQQQGNQQQNQSWQDPGNWAGPWMGQNQQNQQTQANFRGGPPEPHQ